MCFRYRDFWEDEKFGELDKDPQIKVILNTAHPQYKENFMTWGAEAYVIKSSDFMEFKQKIPEVLEKRKEAGKS